MNDWNRREHFEFFSKMTNPYFGVVAEVECTTAYETTKESKISFFSYYLYKSMVAVNTIKELKLRIIGDDVYELDTVHAGTTIARKDGTFAFAFIPFKSSFEEFNDELMKETMAVNESKGLRLNNDDTKKDLIRHSVFPWYSFTGLSHPFNANSKDSVPKITFGKFKAKKDKLYLPVSVEAHHGLVDGFHIAQYLEEFERRLRTV